MKKINIKYTLNKIGGEIIIDDPIHDDLTLDELTNSDDMKPRIKLESYLTESVKLQNLQMVDILTQFSLNEQNVKDLSLFLAVQKKLSETFLKDKHSSLMKLFFDITLSDKNFEKTLVPLYDISNPPEINRVYKNRFKRNLDPKLDIETNQNPILIEKKDDKFYFKYGNLTKEFLTLNDALKYLGESIFTRSCQTNCKAFVSGIFATKFDEKEVENITIKEKENVIIINNIRYPMEKEDNLYKIFPYSEGFIFNKKFGSVFKNLFKQIALGATYLNNSDSDFITEVNDKLRLSPEDLAQFLEIKNFPFEFYHLHLVNVNNEENSFIFVVHGKYEDDTFTATKQFNYNGKHVYYKNALEISENREIYKRIHNYFLHVQINGPHIINMKLYTFVFKNMKKMIKMTGVMALPDNLFGYIIADLSYHEKQSSSSIDNYVSCSFNASSNNSFGIKETSISLGLVEKKPDKIPINWDEAIEQACKNIPSLQQIFSIEIIKDYLKKKTSKIPFNKDTAIEECERILIDPLTLDNLFD